MLRLELCCGMRRTVARVCSQVFNGGRVDFIGSGGGLVSIYPRGIGSVSIVGSTLADISTVRPVFEYSPRVASPRPLNPLRGASRSAAGDGTALADPPSVAHLDYQ